MASEITVKEFLSKSEANLRYFQRSHESLVSEFPRKLANLVASGIKPKVSSGSSSSPYEINVMLEFQSDTSAAERYVKEVGEELGDNKKKIEDEIKRIDKKIQAFLDTGIGEEDFKKLVKHLNNWIDYIPEMSFEVEGTDGKIVKEVDFDIPSDIMKIKDKWKKVSVEELQKKEAKKYGIDVVDLKKHKIYLEAKHKKEKGRKAADVKDAKKALLSLKGYLDSAELAAACDLRIEKLSAKEAEEKRLEQERKAAEAKAKAEFERKVKIDRATRLFASNSAKKLEEAISILEKIEGDDSQELLAKCKEKLETVKKAEEEAEKQKQLNEAAKLISSIDENKLKEAILILEKLDFGNSQELLLKCKEKLEAVKKEKRLKAEYDKEFPELKEKKKVEQQIRYLEEQILHKKMIYTGGTDSDRKVTLFVVGFFILGILEIWGGVALETAWIAVVGALVAFAFGFAICLMIKTRIEAYRAVPPLKDALEKKMERLEQIKKIPSFEEWKKDKQE